VHDNRCNGCSLREICQPDEVAYLKDLDQRPTRIKPALGIDQVLYVDEPGVMLKKTVNGFCWSRKVKRCKIFC